MVNTIGVRNWKSYHLDKGIWLCLHKIWADFWYSFIHDNDVVARTQPDEVKRQFVRGVPPPLRGYIWQIVSKSRNGGELESEYRELLKRVCPYEKSIRQDLERSFNVKEFFGELNGEGHEALFNVIKAYSLFDQQIGYSQGMFYIVGCLVSQVTSLVSNDSFMCSFGNNNFIINARSRCQTNKRSPSWLG